jgi:hypothetical protein
VRSESFENYDIIIFNSKLLNMLNCILLTINLSRIGYICSLPRNNVLAKHTRYNNTSHISFVCPSDD